MKANYGIAAAPVIPEGVGEFDPDAAPEHVWQQIACERRGGRVAFACIAYGCTAESGAVEILSWEMPSPVVEVESTKRRNLTFMS